MSNRKLLVCLVLALVVSVAFFAGREQLKVRSIAGYPPVNRLTSYALSNAPAFVAPAAAWTTNASPDPNVAAVVRHVKGQLENSRANQTRARVLAAARVSFKNAAQKEAFVRLQQAVGDSLAVYLRPGDVTPMQIKGNPLARTTGGGPMAASQEQTARGFLRENAELLLLQKPDDELRLFHRETDELGRAHLRFAQHYAGLEVWPGELTVHFDAQGNVDVVDGTYAPTPEGTPTQPTISAAQAEASARALVPGGSGGQVDAPQLVLYAELQQPVRLAWNIKVAAGLTHDWRIIVDALDGSTLSAVNRCVSANVAGSGVDLQGVTRPLNVWQQGSTYYLLDTSKAMFNPTTGDGIVSINDARNASENQIIVNNTIQNIFQVSSATPHSWANPDAVSAAFQFSETYEYYRQRHGRQSYDGGSNDIVAVVRIGGLYNAFWNPYHRMMFFGNALPYVGSLDVVGHEFTHGVISSIGDRGVLEYKYQSGALNEAFADIFGEMIEARTNGTNDWLMGSHLPTALRSMSNPGAFDQPSKMSEIIVTTGDQGGVHFNSGIINRAYYLLAAGLQGAIGHADAERIFYRCLVAHMKTQSQFVDARLGCIAAADVLFGANSVQVIKTAEAFDAVEIYAAPASPEQPATGTPAVQASDSAIFIQEDWFWDEDNLCRWEAARSDPVSGRVLVDNVKLSRPTIAGDGSDMLFVGADSSLKYLLTAGGSPSSAYIGLVHSIAVSPDGHFVAFVFNGTGGLPTNQIYLIDTVSNLNVTITLKTPIQDAPPLNNVSYADALDFSPDGKTLIYDARSAIRRTDGSTRYAWSIFAMDMARLEQAVVVSPEEDFDIGNPAFSQTSDRFIVFDARFTNGNAGIVTLDLYQGTMGLVGVSVSGYGYPSFNGDDSYVVFADRDTSTTSGRSVYRQNLSASKIDASGNRSLWQSDAKLAVIFRRASYPGANIAPTIRLDSPVVNATYKSPATVTLAATAGDADGSVVRVEFFNGGQLIGTDTGAPFTMVWTNLPAGHYRLNARAYDNLGASATSSAVTFAVRPEVLAGLLREQGNVGFEATLSLPQTGLYRLETSSNLVNWIPLGTFQSPSNLNFLDPDATNHRARFYRAVKTP